VSTTLSPPPAPSPPGRTTARPKPSARQPAPGLASRIRAALSGLAARLPAVGGQRRVIVWLVVSLLLLIGVFVASLSYLAPEGTDGEEVSYGRLQGVLAPGGQVIEGTFYDFDKRVIGTYRDADGRESSSSPATPGRTPRPRP